MNLQSLTQLGIDESTANILLIQLNNILDEQVTTQVLSKEQELKALYQDELASIKLNYYIETQAILASAKNITAVKALILEKLALDNPDYISNYEDSQESILFIISQLIESEETQFLFNLNKDEKDIQKANKKSKTFKGFKPLESSSSKVVSPFPSYEELCSQSNF
ncbi:MAG: hypothetical protein R3Y29_05045 [bacterium]